MKVSNRLLTVFMVSLLCFGFDQGIKTFVSGCLPKNEFISYFNYILRVGYAENVGGMFLGIGSNLPNSVIVLFLFGVFLYLVLSARQQLPFLIALSMMWSGSVSNFYDRALNDGLVIDFLSIGYGPLRTGDFNMADIIIVAGLFILVFAGMRMKFQRNLNR